MRIKILFSTLIMPIVFLASIEQAAAFKYRFLKGDCCGSMPLKDAEDPGGPIAPFLDSPEVQSCLNKGQNIALVGTKKGSVAYCWEPEPPVKPDPRASTKRAAPVDAAAVRAIIACWNHNGSIARKGQGLSCIDTPQELRRNASSGEPVPGIDISLEQIPGGVVTKGITGADGVARFPGLSPGTYRVVLDNVAMAVENHNSSRSNKCGACSSAPPTESGSEGSGSGPSVNIGIGGIFGSGSTKRPQSDRADGRGSSGSVGAEGGIGINIPLSSGEVWNQPSKSAVGSIPMVGGNLSLRSTTTAAEKEKIKGPNAVNVKLALRDKSSKTIIARTTADDAGSFKFVETPINTGKATALEIGVDIPGLTAGFQYCTLPADPAPSLPLMEECDPGGPVFLNVWTCYNPPCPWEKEEGIPARRKAQKEQAEADMAKRQGMILWTTLSNGRMASFIPRSACDIKDGMEAALVVIGDEPQFAVRISQTPALPQGVIMRPHRGETKD